MRAHQPQHTRLQRKGAIGGAGLSTHQRDQVLCHTQSVDGVGSDPLTVRGRLAALIVRRRLVVNGAEGRQGHLCHLLARLGHT